MIASLENFFMNNLLGKITTSLGVSVATYLASGHLGASVNVDPTQVAALAMGAAHFALDLIQHWRQPVSAKAVD